MVTGSNLALRASRSLRPVRAIAKSNTFRGARLQFLGAERGAYSGVAAANDD